MGHYRPRHRVQPIKLERDITIVVEFHRNGNPKKVETIQATEASPVAFFAEGSGENQDIKWMAWDEFERLYEPEDEIGLHADESPRAAARRHTYEVDDPRRDGYREPRRDDHPRSMWRDSGPVASTRMPVPVHPADSWPVEPYAMPTRKPLTVFGLGEEASEKSSA